MDWTAYMPTALMIVVPLVSFVYMLYVFYLKNEDLNKGEVRRAIAITLTIMYIIALSLSILKADNLDFERDFVEHFQYIYGLIIAFYFGTRAYERARRVG